MTRRVAGLLAMTAIVAASIFGCQGVGKPTIVGSHRFERFVGGGPLDVLDPPQLGAFLATGSPDLTAGQFSPDGQWLYLIYHAEFEVSLAGVSAENRDGVLLVDLRLKGECFMECTETGFQATRVRVQPPIDPHNPPAVAINGAALEIEPWIP